MAKVNYSLATFALHMKRKMIIGIIVLIAGFLLYLVRWNIVHPLKKGVVMIEGRERDFKYHLPGKLSANPRLMIVYHGSGINANIIQIFTGHEFDELADKENNTIIVYPNGYKNNWNDCKKIAPYEAKALNINDVEFTRQIIQYFRRHYNTADAYAVGYSNGGQMVMKLAKIHPEWFRGYAVIDANLPIPEHDLCGEATQPVSLFYIVGQQDPINPYKGGKITLRGKNYGEVRSARETLKYWLKMADFEASSNTHITPATTREDYTSSTGEKVCFVDVGDGGHTIPNRNFRIPIKTMGKMAKGVDAPVLIWEFFKSF
jgi:polyhydroxybutyrate depolymerase